MFTGAEINRIKKNFTESQSRRGGQLKDISDELRGVHKIMFENIDSVLQRGELVSGALTSLSLAPVPRCVYVTVQSRVCSLVPSLFT